MTTERPSSHDAETAPVSSRPASSSAEAISKLLAAEKLPDRIGEYRITRLIGSGGMGNVYLAQKGDATFSQTVALKVIKKGMDSEEILRRFELERQLLSGLNHPNIARLVDGGTTDDGRPFFALEYVDGRPIDKYCDANRLSTRDRLTLFRKVCAAVHYAHQNLIVHRDLKPGNVLINEQGEPKLLDFGIAKLLNPTLFQAVAVTGPAVRLMTPEYASPEQVVGDRITTASDIYSLGVMLYELLTGRRPYKFRTRLQQEIIRIVCEEPPERPSTVISRVEEQQEAEGKTRRVDPSTVAETREGDIVRLRKRLRGDIDDIVLKALEKAPSRRYHSAEQFADDIQRHLIGEPVIARPPSLTYRAGKFILRNRVPVAAAAGITAALILGVVGTSVQWARAEQARNIAVAAQREEAQAREVAEQARQKEEEQRKAAEEARRLAEKSYRDTWDVLTSYINEVHAAVARLAGGVEAREIIVETASKKMQGLADQWPGDPEKQLVVSGGFERLGQLAADIRGGSLGQTSKALAFQQQSLAMRRKLLDSKPEDPLYQRAVATSHIRIADLQMTMGDIAAAEQSYRTAVEFLEKLDGEGRGKIADRVLLISAIGQLGDLKRRTGDLPAARPYYERSDSLRRAVRDLLIAEAAAPDLDEREARARLNAALGGRRNVTVGQIDLARLLGDMGQVDEALPVMAEAVAERRRILEHEPKAARYRRDLAVALYYSSFLQSDAGRHADALREANEGAEIMAALTAEESARPDARNLTTLGLLRSAVARAGMEAAETSGDPRGSYESALRSWIAASEVYTERLAADPENADLKQLLAESRSGAAECLLALGRTGEARESIDLSLRLIRPLAAQSPDDWNLKRRLSQDLRRLGDVLAATAPPDKQGALAAYTEALELARAIEARGLRPIDHRSGSGPISDSIRLLDASR